MQKDYKTNLKSTQHSLKTEMDLNSLQLLYETQKNYLKKLWNTICISLEGAPLKTGRIKNKKEPSLFSVKGRLATVLELCDGQAEIVTM